MTEDTRKLLTVFLGIAVVAVAIVLGAYFYVFAPRAWFTFSRDSEEWARFGEYVGGSLGAVFGLLAFGGVLFTIREQHRQAEIEEFQRQLSVFAQRVEAILSAEPAEADEATRSKIQQFAKTLSVFSLLAAIGNQAMRDPDADYLVQASHEKKRQLVIPTIDRQLKISQLELQHLVWCLEQYLEMGGSPKLVELYFRIYQPVVCWLHVLGMLTSDTVRDYFKPEEFRAAWRAAP
jgi:hypothetical protein